ncbi:MAG: leucine-rich repeat domain-containing protein [Prevotella sp.]|nr:leucine-rich repeat domain-containing protein [Prevotella sp.]
MKTKRLLLSFVALLSMTHAMADVEINETNFPDANFRSYLLSQNYDYDGDGLITDTEIADITYMFVEEMNISSLKGIEFFTALETLHCNNNQLTTLDVSKNTALETLYCDNNQLTTLNVSGLPALHTLSCIGNQLTTLDISGCISLGADIENSTERGKLVCALNKIKGASMDALIASMPNISGMLYAIYFENEGNVMTAAQVAAARAKGWKPMVCSETNAWQPYLGEGVAEPAPIDINETNFPDGIFRNYVSSNFDLNQNGKLEYAEIASATNIKVNKMGIQSMKGIEYFTELEQLKCKENQLTTLDISNNPLLYKLDVTRNQLTTLDISKNLALEDLYVAGNQLTTLDVSKHSALVQLECESNQLTALDLSNKPKLEKLLCDNNQLTTLDFSEAPVLYNLRCYNNQIKGAAMDVLVNSLPQYKDDWGATQGTFRALTTKETEGNVMTTTQVAVAKAKGWIPNIGEYEGISYYDGRDQYKWKEYEGSEASGIKSIKTIGSDENVSDDQAKWYDLSGRRLTGKPERKGIYIRNGKKVVMK